MQITPYLTFDGNCAEAFRFYEQALGGKVVMMMTHGEAPPMENMPPVDPNRIMHAQLEIGDGTLMGSDAMGGHGQAMAGFHVSLMPATVAEAERVWAALAEGGQVRMPLGPTFWSPRFGMLADRFGTPWMVNCTEGMSGPA